MHAYCQCSQSGVDDVEAVVEVGQLVEQQPGPGAGQGAGQGLPGGKESSVVRFL